MTAELQYLLATFLLLHARGHLTSRYGFGEPGKGLPLEDAVDRWISAGAPGSDGDRAGMESAETVNLLIVCRDLDTDGALDDCYLNRAPPSPRPTGLELAVSLWRGVGRPIPLPLGAGS